MPESHVLYDEADKLKDAGKLDEAVAKLNELLAADPDYTLAHSALAVILTRLKRHEEAIRHGIRVCELAPNDPFSFTALSVTYQRAGRIPEAEDAMARANDSRALTQQSAFKIPSVSPRPVAGGVTAVFGGPASNRARMPDSADGDRPAGPVRRRRTAPPRPVRAPGTIPRRGDHQDRRRCQRCCLERQC